jgi:CRP-like cAMP-binding protein
MAKTLLENLQQNKILGAISKEVFVRLIPHVELVQLRLGEMIYEPNEQLSHAYFPTNSIVSLHYMTESGASSETSGVGNEGVVGISLFMGGNTTPSSAVVQTAGQAYRIERHKIKEEFNRSGLLQRILLRYTQALITQIGQNSTCNRHHSIAQQLCRWLLLTSDRTSGGELVMTHELVASMLGVRRESVTEAARNLQELDCISYRRGHITVIDRNILEGLVCECYGVVKKEMHRLMENVR